MNSPQFFGVLMLSFALISTSIASAKLAVDCAWEKVGDQVASVWACTPDHKTYTALPDLEAVCKSGEIMSCCVPNKEMSNKNCKDLPYIAPAPRNALSCVNKKLINGTPAPNMNCKDKDGHYSLKPQTGCKADEKTTCCITLPNGQVPEPKDCFDVYPTNGAP
ncbi:hypothetical protein PGT21_014703 [Puccinia graminis f. sp. tritici]|uniref:Uncharacterized protein n=1 Tax=Puccinia graminis f. sp. tritici TaxID=56615 RepID=A0A5B0LTB2_PUCGR|nr:hypothetical protein PGT21_014703 [Puccinia graminis f. sp. tritici]KAA1093564.1 hypothetical protein PGTUg99_027761 [Puccinia graminis f. sp. tritici]